MSKFYRPILAGPTVLSAVKACPRHDGYVHLPCRCRFRQSARHRIAMSHPGREIRGFDAPKRNPPIEHVQFDFERPIRLLRKILVTTPLSDARLSLADHFATAAMMPALSTVTLLSSNLCDVRPVSSSPLMNFSTSVRP